MLKYLSGDLVSGRKRRIRLFLLSSALVALSFSIPGLAAENSVVFSGTLLESPPCVVNAGEQIIVNFGDEVMTTRVDGKQYREKVDFTLDCSAALSSKQKVRIIGNTSSAGFGGTVLTTMKNGLGIALQHGEAEYVPGEWLNFDANQALPALYAVPVKQDGVPLTGGSFSVLASLVVDYQ